MNKYLLPYQYLKKYAKNVIFVVIISIISSIFEGFSIVMLIPVLQNVISKRQTFFNNIPFLNKVNFLFENMTQKEILSVLVVFIIIMILLKNIFSYVSSVLSNKLKYKVTVDFREKLMDNILYCGNRYYDTVKSGHLVSSIYYETIKMGIFLYGILNISVVIIRAAVYVLILAFVSWKMSLVLGLIMLAVFPFIQNIIKKVKALGDISSTASSKFNFVLLEILNGIRVIKSFATEAHEKERFKKADEDFVNTNYKYEKYNFLISPLSETIILTLFMLIFFIGIRIINADLALFIPAVLIYVVLLNRTMLQVNMINVYRGQLANNLSAFHTYEEIENNIKKFRMKNGNKILENFKCAIEFKDVNFSYIEGCSVLKNINISIQKGKTVAIVGATGSGKSTLVNLIPRFYDATSGDIAVDGIPLKELDIYSWRRKIGIVSQDVFIFNTTVRENIKYGSFSTTDEEVENAAKVANAHEFITQLPDGYDTLVGERGVRLSGGQKQRISIARAIINNPEILILDEATSAMDTKTERLIQDAVDNLTKNRTVVAIAHRLSTIQNADEIIVLEEGRVVEAGNHAELLQKNGHYKAYYAMQYN